MLSLFGPLSMLLLFAVWAGTLIGAVGLLDWALQGGDNSPLAEQAYMLAYYRSQHDNQSWLAALAVVMDACALILVGVEALPPLQARMTFSMTRQVLVEMAGSFRVEPSRNGGGDRLSLEVWDRMIAEFAEAGLMWTEDPGARDTLAALRATYEPLLDGLSRHLLKPMPGWMPENKVVDHWARGHRGLIASRLMEGLSDRSAPKQAPTVQGGPLWRRLRRGLRAE